MILENFGDSLAHARGQMCDSESAMPPPPSLLLQLLAASSPRGELDKELRNKLQFSSEKVKLSAGPMKQSLLPASQVHEKKAKGQPGKKYSRKERSLSSLAVKMYNAGGVSSRDDSNGHGGPLSRCFFLFARLEVTSYMSPPLFLPDILRDWLRTFLAMEEKTP